MSSCRISMGESFLSSAPTLATQILPKDVGQIGHTVRVDLGGFGAVQFQFDHVRDAMQFHDKLREWLGEGRSELTWRERVALEIGAQARADKWTALPYLMYPPSTHAVEVVAGDDHLATLICGTEDEAKRIAWLCGGGV